MLSAQIRALLEVAQFGSVTSLERGRGFGFVGLTQSSIAAWFHFSALPAEVLRDLKVGATFWFAHAPTETGLKVTGAWSSPKSMPKLRRLLLEQKLEDVWLQDLEGLPKEVSGWLGSWTSQILPEKAAWLVAERRRLKEQLQLQQAEQKAILARQAAEARSRQEDLKREQLRRQAEERAALAREKAAVQARREVLIQERLRQQTEAREAWFIEKAAEKARQDQQARERIEKAEEARRDNIRELCTTLGISRLVHFTPTPNLPWILEEGLLSRQTLEERPIKPDQVFPDDERLDRCLHASCLSVGFPNYKFFYAARGRRGNTDWVVLEFTPAVLWELDCAFCQQNAACSQEASSPLSLRRKPEALRRMFGPFRKLTRESLKLPDGYPTHPQAEVLVLEPIPVNYLARVHFDTQGAMSRWSHSRSQQAMVVTPDLFRYRSDFQSWQPQTNSVIPEGGAVEQLKDWLLSLLDTFGPKEDPRG